MPTTVRVESGLIHVAPSFADMLRVKRLGGHFSSASRDWEWPATEANARRLHDGLRAIKATPEFDALLSPLAARVQEHFDTTPAEVVVANAERPVAPAPAPPPAIVVPAPAPEIVRPAGLLTDPWRHQAAAFKFCTEKFGAGLRGLLLAMSMGTGKSLVFCMLLLALAARRTLIACPLRVVPVWITQFERHVGIPVTMAALDDDIGSVAEKQRYAADKMALAQTLGQPYVCVINYDSGWRPPFADWAIKQQWDLAGYDEVHKLKAANGRASKYFARLSMHAARRVGMTGTPMPHNHTDIFGVLRSIDMGIFGQYWGPFRREYCQMGGYKNKQIVGPRNLPQLESKVARVMFRVGPEVLDLPPATEVTYRCELSPEGRRVYRTLDQFFVAGVKDGTITVANAMVKVLRLAQLTGGWLPTDDGEPVHVDDSKQKLLEDTLEDIGPDEPVVVWCWFHQDLDAVHDACRHLKYSSLELSGRADELKKWQEGGAQVLAVQIKSGGVGVDCTRARYSIFYSLGFSLADYEQAMKRLHRPGQERPVEHIHLVCKGTVDERIIRALEKRAEVINSILAEIMAAS